MINNAPVASRSARILVVDDREEDRHLLADYLRRQGYRLYVAEDGRDGVEKALYIQPDLILMDVHMPVCDGIAACRLLKAEPKTMAIPLIFLTAAALPEERVRGLLEGAVDYITKPFNFDEVRLRVCVHLNAVHGQDQPTGAADEEGPSGSVEAAIFLAAQRRILQDLASTPELASLARSVGTNTRLLNEAFRKFVGVTVFDYLREARMKEAMHLLSETELEVQTIANDLGYASAANFSTAFRERFGLSPRQYRKVTPKATEGT
jgi:DNA-binding response OmpR family regulator